MTPISWIANKTAVLQVNRLTCIIIKNLWEMIVIYLVIKINFKSQSFIFNFDTFKYVFIVYKLTCILI